MQDFAAQHGAQRFDDILDIGCSAGISTRALAEAFPEAASVAGLDLSPHFLAVAEYMERCNFSLPHSPAACVFDSWAHTASAQLSDCVSSARSCPRT